MPTPSRRSRDSESGQPLQHGIDETDFSLPGVIIRRPQRMPRRNGRYERHGRDPDLIHIQRIVGMRVIGRPLN
jgi:hypothetical protein